MIMVILYKLSTIIPIVHHSMIQSHLCESVAVLKNEGLQNPLMYFVFPGSPGLGKCTLCIEKKIWRGGKIETTVMLCTHYEE